LRILTLSALFPNKQQPTQAIFVKNRIYALSKFCEVKVVAPVPWVFLASVFIRKYRLFARIHHSEIQDGMDVLHPRYLVIPKIGRCLYGFTYFLFILSAIRKIDKSYNFDILDVHWAYPDGFAGVLLAQLLRKPVSITVRGSDINLYTKFYLRRKMITYALKRASKVIAVCGDMQDKVFELGVEKQKFAVIPNGVDIDRFYPLERNCARAKLDLPQDRRIILSVGRLEHPKRFDHVIEAVNILTNEKGLLEPLLLIVGAGRYRRTLEKQIEKLKLTEHVRLVGSKPNEELVYWYNAADIFCLASSSEGWPNVLFESLACGTPVAASAVGGIPEVIHSDKYGFLIHKQDATEIASVLGKALQRNYDRDELTEYARRNTWDKVAERVYGVFGSIKPEHGNEKRI